MNDNTLPTDGLELLNIKDNRELKKFYAKWSVTASKLIQQYAKDHSLNWFNTKWKNKSKDIPFYIRLKAPKSFIGNIWFASRPTNYAFAKGVEKMKVVKKAFPKHFKVKPVKAYGRWFTPKKYKPDIKNIDRSITDIDTGPLRFFTSKTSHVKTHKYSRPLLWYQYKYTREKGPVTTIEQLSDMLYNDPETYKLVLDAFKMTLESK